MALSQPVRSGRLRAGRPPTVADVSMNAALTARGRGYGAVVGSRQAIPPPYHYYYHGVDGHRTVSASSMDRSTGEHSAIITAAFASAALASFRCIRRSTSRRNKHRDIIHPDGPIGAVKLAQKLLEGSDQQFKDLFRLDQPTFRRLVSWLQNNAGLRPSRHQSPELKVMVVLWILAHAESQRNTAHKFQVSQSTVSDIVSSVLPMLVSLHKAYVRLPADDWVDERIELDPVLNAFNGCIGAIDGTHIAAFIPANKQLRWRDRKGRVTQNVFAAVRSDYTFSYVLAGAEGSINDATLCSQAFGRSFRVPDGRYYVADSGFGSRNGIVIPFPGVRYHLQDWRDADEAPATAKELYNLRHARIRVAVEQAFGHLKRRWKIVRIAPIEYSIQKQVQIVYAVTGLHNFMCVDGRQPLTQEDEGVLQQARERASRVVGSRHLDHVRHTAAAVMWEKYLQHRSQQQAQ